MSETIKKHVSYPKISIVTPSFNQGQFLEETIRSVLEQGYPNLEYVIIDGSSTDSSIDIIHKYECELAYWVSERDDGQYDAINKGFLKTSGEIMAWLNADDKYTPWAFSIVAEIFSVFPQVEWLTTSHALIWDKYSRVVQSVNCKGFNRHAFFKGVNLPGRNWYTTGWIQQESTFWRRSLWNRVGKIDASLKMAGDFDLWAKFFLHTELYSVSTPLGGFRVHSDQKTAHHMFEYIQEAETILQRYGGHPYGRLESAIRNSIRLCIGDRAIPRKLFPKSLAMFIDRTSLLYPVKFCNWSKDGWETSDSYIL